MENQNILGKDVSLPETLSPAEFKRKYQLAKDLFNDFASLVYRHEK